jgi:hypothetical protein
MMLNRILCFFGLHRWVPAGPYIETCRCCGAVQNVWVLL